MNTDFNSMVSNQNLSIHYTRRMSGNPDLIIFLMQEYKDLVRKGYLDYDQIPCFSDMECIYAYNFETEEVVGAIVFREERGHHPDYDCWIHMSAVKSSLHGTGVFDELIRDFVCRVASERGIKLVGSAIHKDNVYIQNAVERQGRKSMGRHLLYPYVIVYILDVEKYREELYLKTNDVTSPHFTDTDD